MPSKNKSGTIRFKVQSNDQKETLTIQSNLNQSFRPFESQLFTPVSSNIRDIGDYDYPVYFYYYFRAAFFLCLVPFWVNIKEQTNVQFGTYKFQRFFCAIVHISAFVLNILWFRSEAVQSIKEHPEKVFEMTRYFIYAVYVVAYAKVVWSQQIKDLFEEIPPTRNRKVIQN